MNKVKQYFVKSRLKGDLMKCFRSAKIYKEFKSKDQTHKQYPKIHDVHVDFIDEVVRYTFTIPVGMNPEKIFDNQWIFVQVFTNAYTLHCQKNRKFILTTYANGFPPNPVYPFSMDEYKSLAAKSKIPCLIGHDEKGKVQFLDLLRDPHLLVMGETGSGKSVFCRSLITFLSLHLRDRVEFVLGDLKRSEFFLFRNVDNVRSVSIEETRLQSELLYVQSEIERRGNLFDAAEVPNIEEYEKETGVKLPYIIVCIDEVALLEGNECMDTLKQISCVGRSLGVILILSLQRGDAKVLDGQLKNNLTNRAVFRTADKINSNIGLGAGVDADASTILKSHKGKFYFKSEDLSLMQAPFLEIDEAKRLLAPFKKKPIDPPTIKKDDDLFNDFDIEGDDQE